MKMWGLLAVVLSGVAYGKAQPSSWGYGLRFQDEAAIAAPKTGIIDFSHVGWVDVATEFTVSAWVKHDVDHKDPRFAFSFVTDEDTLHFQPCQSRYATIFGAQYVYAPYDANAWHYCTAVVSGGTLKIYHDGVLSSEGSVSKGLNDGTNVAFYVGAHLYSRVKKQAVARAESTFFGAMDELTLWSRALTQGEILERLQGPIDVSGAIDSSIVLHYNFDVSCPITSVKPDDPACGLSGDGIVRNWGSAGSDYDLVLGQTDDSYGFGKTYVHHDDTSECPAKYTFAKPMLTHSGVPNPGSVETLVPVPQVYTRGGGYSQTFTFPPGGSSDGYVFINGTIPVVKVSTGDILALEEAVPRDTELRVTTPAEFTEPIKLAFFKIDDIGAAVWFDDSPERRHEIHIWPHKKPVFNKNIGSKEYSVTTLEDQPMDTLVASGNVFSPCGEELLTIVTKLPEKGTLTDALFVYGEGVQRRDEITSTGVTLSSPDGLVVYVPDKDGSGLPYDSFKVKFKGKDSLLETDELTVGVGVYGMDDLPLIGQTNAVTAQEDSVAGTIITLNVSDPESSFGILITELPKKGDLYLTHPNGSKADRISKAFELFDVGKPHEQYVESVIGVSTFWGKAPYTGYHVMNVIGPQTCNYVGECHVDFRFLPPYQTIEEGHLIQANIHYEDPGKEKVYTWSQVTKHVSGTKQDAFYDVVTRPMLNEAKEPCTMVGKVYPDNCTTDLIDPETGVRAMKNISFHDLKSTPGGMWSPRNKDYLGDDQENTSVIGKMDYFAYGEVCEYNWNQAVAYMYETPKYTEYIEVEYPDEVFVVSIEIGQPRGSGGIVNIKVRDPNGVWQSIFSDDPNLNLYRKTNGRGIYTYFTPPVCRPPFKTKQVRIEVDTSSETGSQDWNYIDYIKLIGAKTNQKAVLRYPSSKVIYIPHENAVGQDSFSFEASDCIGSTRRSTAAEKLSIFITPSEDAPEATHSLTQDLNDNSAKIVIQAHDVDNELINVQVTKAPLFGALYVDSGYTEQVKVDETVATGTGNTSIQLWFKPGKCVSPSHQEQIVFSYAVTDSVGVVTTNQVAFKTNCLTMPRKHYITSLSPGAKTLSSVLACIGIVFALVCFAFNWHFRRLQVVRLTSPRINMLIILGCGLVYLYLIVSSAGIPDDYVLELEKFDFADDAKTTLTCKEGNSLCSDYSGAICYWPMILLVLGIILAFGSIFLKTLRIITIFNSKMKKVKPINDFQVASKVFFLVVIFGAFMLLWGIKSPIRVDFRLSPEEINSAGEILVPMSAFCTSDLHGTFLTILTTSIGTVLVYGAYLAFSVRNVKVSQVNDSKQIGLSVYNILIFGTLNMVLTTMITDETQLFYMITTLTWFTTTTTACVLYIPRMLDVKHGKVVSFTGGSTNTSGVTHTNMDTVHTVAEESTAETAVHPAKQ